MLLVDDASTDDSVAMARRTLPDLRVVELPVNRGPGGARNAGLAALDADRVLFVDNDVHVGDRVIPLLGEALEAAPDAVLAMPRVVTAAAPDHIEYEGGDAHVSGLQVLRNAGRSVAAAPAPAPHATGSLVSCCCMFDRSRWRGGALFDERLRIYFEDHEAGLRARLLGHELLAVPAATCLHGPGTPGMSIRAVGAHTTTRIHNTILNRWQIVLKLYQGRTLLLMAPSFLLFELFQAGGCLALGWSGHWVRAARDLVRLLPDLARRRRAVQRVRSVSDRALLVAGPHPFRAELSGRPGATWLAGLLDRLTALNWAVTRRLSGRG
jgi:GT2 family glycosyltransferase